VRRRPPSGQAMLIPMYALNNSARPRQAPRRPSLGTLLCRAMPYAWSPSSGTPPGEIVGGVGGVGYSRSDLCRKAEEAIDAGRSERQRARRRDDGGL
jgi:hypothetical protein